MKSFNETLKDALAALACPTDSKEPEKGAWCGHCREVCEADGTNWCDRNKYEPIIRQLEDAHRREVEELATAIRRLAEDACGHCDARYCQGDGEQEHMPCRVVRESLQVADTYCPKPPPPESDDGMPF